MPTLNQKGAAHLLLPIILILGLIAAVYLITSGNPLKLFSKAASNPIIFVLPDGSKCNPATTTCKIKIVPPLLATVRVELTSTLGPPVTSKINLAAVEGGNPALSIAPIFRLYNPRNGDHLYTSNPQERDAASRAGYHFEGIAFYASAMQQAPYAPVYRFYNPRTGEHFYTANQNEANNVRRYGFSPEGIAFYASVSPVAGLIPVYRFIYLPSSFHFYTASESEKNSLLSKRTWRLEEVAFFVPANSKPIPPVPTKAPVSAPITSGTLSYRIAETPTDLDNTPWASYTSEPTVIYYTLRNTTPGAKFIWVDFKDSTGRTDRKSAEIELVASTSGPTPSPTSGSTFNSPSVFGKAIKLNGSQGVTIDGSKLANNQEFTIEGWVKWEDDTQQGYQTLFTKASSTSNANASFDVTISNSVWGKDLLGRVLGANVKVLRAGNVLGDKFWHHVALVNMPKSTGANGLTLYSTQFYVDGKLQDKDDHYATISFGNGNLQIGWAPAGWSTATAQENGSFYGEIDEVRLSKTARYTSDFIPPNAPFTTDNNTVGLWHFDNNLQDSSGLGNDGRGTNITQYVDSVVPGYSYQPPIYPIPGFGNAIQFNQGGFVQTNQTHTMGKFTNVTMEAWIRLARTGESNPIISKKMSGNYAYSLEITPQNKLKFTYSVLYQNRWAPTEIESTSTINPDNWNHVAVVYNSVPLSADQGKLSLYINGLRVAQTDQTGEIGGGSETSYGANVLIGTDPSVFKSFNGVIDEVRISNGVKYLGPGRAGATPGVFSPALDTLLLCHFNETSGNPSCTNGSGATISTISGNITYLKGV